VACVDAVEDFAYGPPPLGLRLLGLAPAWAVCARTSADVRHVRDWALIDSAGPSGRCTGRAHRSAPAPLGLGLGNPPPSQKQMMHSAVQFSLD